MIKNTFNKLKKLSQILTINAGEMIDVMGFISKKGEVTMVK